MTRSRLTQSALAVATAITLLATTVLPRASAHARGPITPAAAVDTAAAPTSVLGLEAADEAKGVALTDALRSEFQSRGVGGGQNMSLVELRLTMGCDEPASIECLSEGGKSLGVSHLVYGSLTDSQLKLTMLNVETRAVERSVAVDVTPADLEPGAVAATAKRAADQMLGAATATDDELPSKPKTPGPEDGAEGPDEVEKPKKQRQSNLEWGKHSPVKKWKKTGLWVSVGFGVASLGTAIGTTVAYTGPIRKELDDAVAASRDDDKNSNDIDAGTTAQVCEQARAEPEGEPGTVTNASVTTVCNKGDAVALTATISWAVFGVSLAAIALFTTLHFVRKKETGAAARLRERGVHFGVAPTPRGGVSLGGGFRF